MTLATPRINEFAEKFYLRFLRRESLSADASSDMYDQFIRQMKKYRSKHPETVRVGAKFVRRVKKTKKMVAERFAKKVGKAMEVSRLWYCRSLKAELRSKDAAPEKRATHEAMRKEFLRRQRRAQKTGRGTYYWSNGNKYTGDFLEDEITGRGIYYWANGNRFEGSFKNGLMTGGYLYVKNGKNPGLNKTQTGPYKSPRKMCLKRRKTYRTPLTIKP